MSGDEATDSGKAPGWLAFPAPFLHVLVNTLFVSVIDMTVFFAITFWSFLQTGSVFATSMIAGLYLLMTALSGIWFGSLVDHHRKKTMLLISTATSFVLYLIGLVIERTADPAQFTEVGSPRLWVLVVVLTAGVIAGNIRGITMPVIVTLLIPADRRDRANGLVGSALGTSFLVTSVISGLLVGAAGMLWVLILGMSINLVALAHLSAVKIPEEQPVASPDGQSQIDFRGTYRLVRAVPGLLALIAFSAINNLLGGVFMALVDPYGLSMMSVQSWGLLWGVLSTGFIVGGLVIAKTGLGRNPVRSLLLANVVLWSITIGFPIRESILLLAIGLYCYMLLMPFVEAAEQTVLQQVVPVERQGRVFGFAQSIELSAAPLTAFFIGPMTQFVFIPFMTDGFGADWIGGWFGTGPARGIALVFVVTAVIGLVFTALALTSTYYRRLSTRYRELAEAERGGSPTAEAPEPVWPVDRSTA